MDKKLLEKPENYYNREMSWLQFNYRILNEAKDKSISQNQICLSSSWCV